MNCLKTCLEQNGQTCVKVQWVGVAEQTMHFLFPLDNSVSNDTLPAKRQPRQE